MSPNRTPQTPNIFDILIDSITTPLKHTKEKPKPSPPPQKPTTPSQSFSKPDWQKPHQGPQPTQSQKPQASKNDDFNFLTWLFFPVQSTKSTQAPTNQPKSKTRSILKSTTTNTQAKQQVSFAFDAGNCSREKGRRTGKRKTYETTYDDELKKLANFSKDGSQEQEYRSLYSTYNPKRMNSDSQIFTNAFELLQAMADEESPLQRQERIIQKFLVFFKSKMHKPEFDNFQKLFLFGLSCEAKSDTSNQGDIKISKVEINKFLTQIKNYEYNFTDEFSEIANKSIDGLTKYLANQNSSIDAKTKTPELPQILENFYNELLITNSFFYDKKDIVQGLLDPDIEDSFFWQHFSITQPGDSYQPGKSMVLERAEELLKFYVSVLKRNSENSLNNELISSFLDSQEQRGIKALHKRFSYFGTHSPTSPSRHFSPLTTKLPFSLSPDIRSAIC